MTSQRKNSTEKGNAIRGTNGTKREKYGEKYSGVNAAIMLTNCWH